MTREQLIAYFKKQTNADELVEALEAIENGYVEEIGKRNSEAKNKRTEAKDALGKLKAVQDRLEQVCDAFGVDSEAEDLEDALEAAKKTKSSDPAMQKKIDRLEKKLKEQETELTSQLEAERSKRLDSVKRTAVMDALNKHNAKDASSLVKMFLAELEVAEDGETLTLKNEKGMAVTVEDGIKDWLSTRQWAVSNTGQPGSGGGNPPSGGGQGGDEVDKFVMSLVDGPDNNDKTAKANEYYFGTK